MIVPVSTNRTNQSRTEPQNLIEEEKEEVQETQEEQKTGRFGFRKKIKSTF